MTTLRTNGSGGKRLTLTAKDREVLEAARASAEERLAALIYTGRGDFRPEFRHLLDGDRLMVELLDELPEQQSLFEEVDHV